MNYKPQTLTALLIVSGIATSGFSASALTRSVAAAVADEPAAPASSAAGEDAAPTSSAAGEDAAPTSSAAGEDAAPTGSAAGEEAAPTSSAAGQEADPASSVAGETPDPSVPAAQDVLTQVRAKLESVDSLKCSVQETAILSGMKFTAFGNYVQASGNRVRLEFQIFPSLTAKSTDGTPKVEADVKLPDPKTSSGQLLQVSTGSILYSEWKNGPIVRVTRRNLADIFKAAGETTNYDASRAVQDLGVGGLTGLIARLQSTMDFAIVKRENHGGVEMLVLTGRWTQKVRKEIFRIEDDVQIIPEDFVPEYARLYIDSQTMLPRRLQYLKRAPNPGQKLVRPIVTLDFRQIVLNEAVADELFSYKAPDNVPEEDITEQTIKSMQLLTQPKAETPKSP